MKKKWLWGTLAAVVLLLFLGYRLYIGIHEEEWKAENEAVMTAYEKTVLAKATKVEPFIGEKPYMIVYGEDKLGQRIIVWVGEQDIHTEYVKDGVSQEQLRQTWQQADPDRQLLRIMPAKLDRFYAWEVFYKKQIDGKDHYFYDYYNFTDGALIDTYRLTLK